MMPVDKDTVAKFATALLSMDKSQAAAVLADFKPAESRFDLISHTIYEALQIIGAGWDSGQSSLAQIYMAGIICEELLEQYLPSRALLRHDSGRIGLAVLQDHHVLGKRIVASILHASGYDFLDLGQGLSPDELVEEAINNEIDILLISVLMLPSALAVRRVVEGLKEHGSPARVIVGGAPFRFDPDLWRKVEAHAFGNDAAGAPEIIARVVKNDG